MLFRSVALLADLPESAVPAGTDIFRYARPGDSRTIEAPDTHS